MSSNAYHVTAVFRRVMDAPRPDWPYTVVERVGAIAGVVDASFPDLTASWAPLDGDGITRESRRRFIEVYVSAATPAAARSTLTRLRALILELAAELELGPVTLVVLPAESVEVLGR